jgi:hypothetical protein
LFVMVTRRRSACQAGHRETQLERGRELGSRFWNRKAGSGDGR